MSDLADSNIVCISIATSILSVSTQDALRLWVVFLQPAMQPVLTAELTKIEVYLFH